MEKEYSRQIDEFREEALYYSKSGKRFKILIETVTGCYGSCLGCAFTENDRMQFNPKINASELSRMFDRLKYLLDYNNPNSIVEKYETTVINFGGSEHFIYDNEYLGELFENTGKFFDEVNTKRNVLAFSSSGLLNIDKMEKKSKRMIPALKKEQFVVDMVIDLARFEKLKDRYQKSFDFFKENFGFIDLAVNLEANSSNRDWIEFCKFIDDNEILNIDLVYAINKNNKEKVSIETNSIFSIYETIVKNTKNGKSLFDLHGLLRTEKEKDKYEDTLDLIEICKKAANTILKNAIFIDSKFDVYPALFVVFADVPLNDRVEIKKIANLYDEDFKDKFINYEKYLAEVLIKSYGKSIQCSDCPILSQCYKTGAPILNKYLNVFKDKKVTRHEDCQNPVRNFILAKNTDLSLKEDCVS